MKINKRLTKLSNYIDNFSNVIDVGCDHALLCIYLVNNKQNIKCIASDINEGPLLQAKKNIESYNLKDFIKIKLGNGISTIEDYIDTIVISGMGGKTIVDILKNDKDKLKNIKTILLSPNNDFSYVRKELSNLGFKIICEEIIYEKSKFYPIIVLEKGVRTYSEEELLLGYNVVKNDDVKLYYKYLLDNYNKRMDNIPDSYVKERKELKKVIAIIKEKI